MLTLLGELSSYTSTGIIIFLLPTTVVVVAIQVHNHAKKRGLTGGGAHEILVLTALNEWS